MPSSGKPLSKQEYHSFYQPFCFIGSKLAFSIDRIINYNMYCQQKSKSPIKSYIPQQQSIDNENKIQKRIVRKPQKLIANTPKTSNSIKQSAPDLQSQKNLTHSHFDLLESKSTKVIAKPGSMIKIGYISPKGKNISNIVAQKQIGQQKKCQLVSSKSIVSLKLIRHNQLSKTQTEQYLGNRKRLSKNKHQPKYCKTSQSDLYKNLNDDCEESQSNTEISRVLSKASLNLENEKLMRQKMQLEQRVKDLKQQNSYLYSELQFLSVKIQDQKQQNRKLKQRQNDHSQHAKLMQEQIWKYKEIASKKNNDAQKYQILLHIYQKLRHQNHSMRQENLFLKKENKRFSIQIDNEASERFRRKSNMKRERQSNESSCNLNKQNLERTNRNNVNLNGIRSSKIVQERGQSRKEEGFFQLSPQ